VNNDPFFLVWSPEGWTPPRVKHPTQAKAQEVAEQMARENPGKTFFVVQALSVSCVQPPRITYQLRGAETGEEIPF
jgi:hypothetical protein